MTKITIGARGSKLSIAYVEKVKELLIQKNNDLREENIDFKAIKTSGDINQNVKLSEIGGKNLFCKEIEEKLQKKEIDIAVHSLKDMESAEDSNLIIGAYMKRNDPTRLREKFKRWDKDENGVWSLKEAEMAIDGNFKWLDKDKNKSISIKEMPADF